MSPLEVGGKKKTTTKVSKPAEAKEKKVPRKRAQPQLTKLQIELATANGRNQVLEEMLTKARRFPQWKDVMDTILSYDGTNKDMLLLKNQAGPKNSNQKFMWRLYSLIQDMYIGAQE